LAEFIHVSTDARRFDSPLTQEDALKRAKKWWNVREVTPVFSTTGSTARFLDWMGEFDLGRKRILDTLLAASYVASGVQSIVTLDLRDFARFPSLAPITLR